MPIHPNPKPGRPRVPPPGIRIAAPIAPWVVLWVPSGLAGAAEEAGAAGQVALGDHALQMILGLGLVLALIVAIAWFVKRFLNLPSATSGPLKVIGGISMGAREKVVLLEVGETQLVVGVAPGRIQTLHVLDRPVAAAPPNFAAHLGGSIAGRVGGRWRARTGGAGKGDGA